ncbi:hypothetical protein [Streptomyces globosus]|uniref:hypothetical protein n=1 Tax=Streptomyces globosus TaxID=68209 RepID=UPI0031E4207F
MNEPVTAGTPATPGTDTGTAASCCGPAPAQSSPCCGTRQRAEEAGACCDPQAKREAAGAGAGCC